MISEITSAVGGGLGSLMNLVPTPGKLTIIPVSDYTPVPIPTAPFVPYVAMFNPENWQTQETTIYDDSQPAGSVGAEQRYSYTRARTLSFDLIVDGTGASGETREVLADILYLQNVTGFSGTEHQSNKLFVIWGTQMFQGKLQSMSIKYTLFRPNGTPLRATISLSFVGDTPRLAGFLKLDLQSADRTHPRRVKKSDRLDLLCQYIYRDPRFYIEVARVNGLTTFRKLPVGTNLNYPPVEK
jgi:hypothetical protein